LIGLAFSQRMATDLTIHNSGGIRDGIDEGPITLKDIRKVAPWGNNICSISLTGADLKKYLRYAVSRSTGDGGYPQITVINPKFFFPIVDTKIYKLALNDFLASGGDGYPKLDDKDGFVNSGYPDYDVISDYIKANSSIKRPIRALDYRFHTDYKRIKAAVEVKL